MAGAALFAIAGIYASATSLRDSANLHARVGAPRAHIPADMGIAMAGMAAFAFFLLPWLGRGGLFPAAALALLAIWVPLVGAFLGARALSLGRIVGAVGTGEMVAKFYGPGPALFTGALVAGGAIAALALLLTVAANLIAVISGGAIDTPTALSLAALFVALTGIPGGIRTAASLVWLHGILVLIGAIGAIGFALAALGGLDAAIETVARISEWRIWPSTGERGGGNYPVAVAVSGAFGPADTWSGTTIFSSAVAIGGAILVLAWLPWSMARQDPRQLAHRIAAGALIGGALCLCAAFILGIALLSLAPASHPLTLSVIFPGLDATLQPIGALNELTGLDPHWSLTALFGFGGLAALHALALAILAGAGGALRPIWTSRRGASAAPGRVLLGARIGAGIVLGAAIVLAALGSAGIERASAIAVSLLPLALVPVASAAWFPSVTVTGLMLGLIAGCAVALSETIFGGTAVHSASTGLLAAFAVTFVGSRLLLADRRAADRAAAHAMLDEIFAPVAPDDRSPERAIERGRIAVALIASLVWTFFALGPGIVVGNDLFGAPDAPRTDWDFRLPSIAVWQILCWASGVLLLWFVTRRPGLSILTREQLTLLAERTDRKIDDRR